MKLGLKNIEFSIEKISEELEFQLDFFLGGAGEPRMLVQLGKNLPKTQKH